MHEGEESTIRVNFGKPMPIFPLDCVSLLPQQVLPMHIFEPRYRQMVEHALDGSGQIAMGVFRGSAWKLQYHGRPALMGAVCVGQISQHEKLSDGRFNLLLQGVCRARILRELPAREDVLYREAQLTPIDVDLENEDALVESREFLEESLIVGPLSRFAAAKTILEFVQNEEVPTTALLELVTFAMLPGKGLKYQLLAEGDAQRRASIIKRELRSLESMLGRADRQRADEWPKGMSWN